MKDAMTRMSPVLFMVTVFCGVPLAADADGGRRYSAADVRGAFVSTFDGLAPVPPSGPLVPVASMSRFTADGVSRIAGTRTLSFGGQILSQTFACDFSVSPDGTGEATCTISTIAPPGVPDSQETFGFVIADNRREGYLVSTTPGTIISGAIKRQ